MIAQSSMPTPLPLITALARSGALDRAWALFADGGYDAREGDAAALAVKGRLLKDRAWQADGDDRRRLLAAAASAYAGADAIDPQPYLLINVAACRALAGEGAAAATAADAVLGRIAPGTKVAETPYWLCATRAEAWLIKGDMAKADAALADAIAADPDSFDDHATTLRQFGRLLEVAKGDAQWLDRHRPPVSLHYAGHLAVSVDASASLRAQIDAILERERVGFGYGALAAGSDIVVAEALIARGAALHLVLPAPVEAFATLSVVPYGAEWQRRFEHCLAAAESVHVAAQVGAEAFEPLATALAAELAMGAALLNARRLESHAQQLLVIDDGNGPFGGGLATARDGELWHRIGEGQHLVIAPRSADIAPSSQRSEGRADRRLLALLRLDWSGLDQLGDDAFAAALDQDIRPFMARAASLADQLVAVQRDGVAHIFAFDDVAVAARYALTLATLDPPARFPLCIAGHYGLAIDVEGQLTGPSIVSLAAIAEMALDGAITVSEAFATAAQLGAPFAAQHVGDCFLPSQAAQTRLFTLS